MSKYACYLLVTILFALQLTACARTKTRLPALLQQAERHNLSGIAAESKQEFNAAETEFIAAYRLFSSVENYPGMVATLINSSRVYRRLGNLEKTAAILQQAVSLIPQAPDFEAEICFEMSKLATLKGEKSAALQWAERAALSSSVADRPRMLNLVALLELQTGAVQRGGEKGGAALKAAREVADRREEANACRLLGEIALQEKRHEDAQRLFESALLIDKELAIPARVAADLNALSLVAAARGDAAQGAHYLQRAVAAGLSGKNPAAAAGDLERLIKLYEQSGNSQAADKIRKLGK